MFLSDVVETLDRPQPPALSPGCQWCNRMERAA
jgi:hypothetical protein